MRNPNPFNAFDRMIMRQKIAEDWVPTPGTYYSVRSFEPGVKNRRCYLPIVRASSKQEALEIAVAASTPSDILGPIFVVVSGVVVPEDIPAWEQVRAAWIADGHHLKP